MSEHILSELRERVRRNALQSESLLLPELMAVAALDENARSTISRDAGTLVSELRRDAPITFLQSFLTEYGLSNSEGVALMCLAEAFLRVPDVDTLDQLIAEKITSSNWHAHAGQASAFLVNASTWGLMLSGRLLSPEEDNSLASVVQKLLSRLGEPVIRLAMTEVMERMGEHFVIGETIEQALKRAAPLRNKGYRFSFDMLGEAVRTEADALACYQSYAKAIAAIAINSGADVRDNPGISIKLSALHPRFELMQKPRMFDTLVERVTQLANAAAKHNLGFTIDAEEADRLELTLDLVAAVFGQGGLKDWDGFGVVVQAYSKRALAVIDWLDALARERRCKLSVRLVKGAYWDTEIKRAQVQGLPSYPVYTRKAATDLAYLASARKLLAMHDTLYPQFATHNAHTLTAVMQMASAKGHDNFELQRLHGMGETLHQKIKQQFATRHRIYAPVGEHRDLLAYLVRRLLENGANNSFVHQIRDQKIPVAVIAADPYLKLQPLTPDGPVNIVMPPAIFAPRLNSPGWDLSDPGQLLVLQQMREQWRTHSWTAAPVLVDSLAPLPASQIINPARMDDVVGTVTEASPEQVLAALAAAEHYRSDWAAVAINSRAQILQRAATLFEQNLGEILALLTREAGKTVPDALGEWREAIDFLRYYAEQAEGTAKPEGRGLVLCISPWNFPLAIFTGQIAAALVAGNVVIAKPAEQTPLIACRVVHWLLEAGVPTAALQLLIGDGERLGNTLCRDPRVQGICFTGSLATAQKIHQAMADFLALDSALIAETGGLNAMVVDSTALPEQTIRDVITSAFNSAGQRCSALRILYLQEEIADEFMTMLTGAMDLLALGDPWELETDIGPVIDASAARQLREYVAQQEIIHQVADVPAGNYVAPCLIRVSGIEALDREIFGPVLHVATFKAAHLEQVIAAINASSYGLTFALHTRLRDRVDACVARLRVGNIYINRNQVGAVVGSQPFGGEGMSGTGPKAGGPHYLQALRQPAVRRTSAGLSEDRKALPPSVEVRKLQALLDDLRDQPEQERPTSDRLSLVAPYCAADLLRVLRGIATEHWLPGPTGEENYLTLHGRGVALCLGPSPELALQQALQSLAFGGCALICCERSATLDAVVAALLLEGLPVAFTEATVPPQVLAQLAGVDLVAFAGDSAIARKMKQLLAANTGKIIPLIVEPIAPSKFFTERHVCTDTTAAGGNVALMATTN